MATPVSLCPLKRVEVHDGSTRKSFDADSQGSPLMLSVEAQQSFDAANSLVLLIQAGFQRLVPYHCDHHRSLDSNASLNSSPCVYQTF
jgi:hypothetical protein